MSTGLCKFTLSFGKAAFTIAVIIILAIAYKAGVLGMLLAGVK